jgi:hypothetical protein
MCVACSADVIMLCVCLQLYPGGGSEGAAGGCDRAVEVVCLSFLFLSFALFSPSLTLTLSQAHVHGNRKTLVELDTQQQEYGYVH